MLRWLAPFLLATLLPAQALAWGSLGHRIVAVAAAHDLPPGPAAWFAGAEADLAAHAMDPDHWKGRDHLEGPRHYLDCELYGGPASVPRDPAVARARLGPEAFLLAGQVPWVVLERVDRLAQAFRAGDAGAVRVEAARLSHYVGDLSVPLHTTTNHNGELSGQHGIHHRWESGLVEDLVRKGGWRPPVRAIRRLDDVPGAPWAWLADSHALVPGVLAADLEAAGRPEPAPTWRSHAYWQVFLDLQGRQVERQLDVAAVRTAQLILEAWHRAGEPPAPASR